MSKNNSLVAQATLLAVLGIASVSAHAVPIVFEFTGTAGTTSTFDWQTGQGSSDSALLGQSVVGRITLETDGLTPFTTNTPGYFNLGYSNGASDPLRLVTRELTIGGVDYSNSAYPSQFGGIVSQDFLWPGGFDRISVQHSFSQCPGGSSTVDGQYSSNTLYMEWHDPNDAHGLVDSTLGFDPSSIVSMLNALPIVASYTTGIISCVDGTCRSATQSTTFFEINSSLVHTPSVPEPGTVALFAVGLLGTGLARRRKAR